MMTTSGYVCEPFYGYQISSLLNNESPSVIGEREAKRESDRFRADQDDFAE